jgi:Ca2+-binding EF-hand superfamily protein
MTGSTPSSLSRYRPAILVSIGAAAAYTAYLIYSSLQSTPAEHGLQRSNAVRRPDTRNRRTSAVRRVQRNVLPLGNFDFLGTPLGLDVYNLVTAEELRAIALHSQPDASPDTVENAIAQFYDTFLNRLLALTFPHRPITPTQAEALVQWLSPQLPNATALEQAVERHGRVLMAREGQTARASDDTESIPPTELDWSDEESWDETDANGQTLQRTLYHIAEDRARQDGVVHRGITCNACGTKPIRGVRWRCANCNDFDLCSECEATNSHIKTHIFYKIKVPAPYLGIPKQETVYPGRPNEMSVSINPNVKKHLGLVTNMEAEEIEALWDQFTCLADTEWEDDPFPIGWALDRRAFNQAFIPRYSSFLSAPNLIYDRIFAYYDTDSNGLIGFEEFIRGIAGLHTRDPETKIKIVFKGYDVDGDGYISRKDMLRLFRAYYAIEKEATRNYLAESSEELSVRGALEMIHSSQPLGSAFTQNIIPDGNPSNARRRQKTVDDSTYPGPILSEDADETLDRATMLRATQSGQALSLDGDQDGDQTLRNRWARRQFYTDEEEGLLRPEETEDHDDDEQEEQDDPPSPELERPRGSRSSSRVRFQDDVDFETRSNASTSSRPIGERWGGYEIPEPEQDLGREIMYQIAQQGFNELLNPLFQEKEDNAMDAFATRTERRKLVPEMQRALEEFNREKDINKTVVSFGVFKYARWLLEAFATSDEVKEIFEGLGNLDAVWADAKTELLRLFSDTETGIASCLPPDAKEPDALDLWNAHLCRLQLRHELITAIHDLLPHIGFVPTPSSPRSAGTSVHVEIHEEDTREDVVFPYRDPTMPQFRPNSLADVHSSALSDETSEDGSVTDATQDRTDSGDEHSFDEGMENITYQHIYSAIFIMEAQDIEPLDIETLFPVLPPPRDPSNIPPADSSERALPLPPIFPPQPISPLNVNDPCMFIVWIDTSNLTLHIDPRPFEHTLPGEINISYKPLERKVRCEAMKEDSPLHVPFLASLQEVEDEISERKGSGLLSYAEFEKVLKYGLKDGKMRFLEAWVDWVSY